MILLKKPFSACCAVTFAENEVSGGVPEIQGVDLRNDSQLFEKVTFESVRVLPGQERRLEDPDGQRYAVLRLLQVAGGVFPGFVDHVLQQFMGVLMQRAVGRETLRGQDSKHSEQLDHDQQRQQAEQQAVFSARAVVGASGQGLHGVSFVEYSRIGTCIEPRSLR